MRYQSHNPERFHHEDGHDQSTLDNAGSSMTNILRDSADHMIVDT